MNPFTAALRFYQLRASWLGDGGQPVAPALAQSRADVCLSCPQNQPMPLWETLSALEANRLRRLIALKANMKLAVNGEDGLHVCAPCRCLLSLKVHAPLKRVRETTPLEKLQREGPRCWILTESDTTLP